MHLLYSTLIIALAMNIYYKHTQGVVITQGMITITLVFLMLVTCFEVKGVINLCLLVDGITNCLFINVTDVIVTGLDIINPVIVGYLLVLML